MGVFSVCDRLILCSAVGLMEATLLNFLFTPVAWAESTEARSEPQSEPQSELQLQQIPAAEMHLNTPSTQAADLLAPSEFFSAATAATAIASVQTVQLTEPPQSTDAVNRDAVDRFAQAAQAQNRAFSFSFSTRLADPTALRGSMRRRPISTPIKSTGIAAGVSLNQSFGNGNALNLVLEGGEHIAAFDLGFTQTSEDNRRGFGVNISNQQSWFPAFRGGEADVDLPNGDTPWIDRLTTGVEMFLPIGDEIDTAFGLSYQRIAIRDGVFTSRVFASDVDGNALTVDDDGVDDYITLNFAALLDRRDNATFPRSGFIARLGLDQGFKISDDTLSYTRFSGSFTQYLPFNFIAFDPGPRTLILQLQAGTILGDVPGYEAFNIGGSSSVRSFGGGGVGTGTSFIQAVAEYRFPIAAFSAFSREVNLRGALFVDYGTDLGTAGDVIGKPAEVRNKPGDGFGFGVGLNAETAFGLGRVEFAISEQGESEVIITIGDRF